MQEAVGWVISLGNRPVNFDPADESVVKLRYDTRDARVHAVMLRDGAGPCRRATREAFAEVDLGTYKIVIRLIAVLDVLH